MRNLLSTVIMFGLWLPEAQAEVQRISASDFQEKTFEHSEISGALIVGFQLWSEVMGPDIQVEAHVPEGWGDLCMQVSTIDGLYESQSYYSLPADWEGGVVSLDYPTEYGDRLLRLDSGELAALVRRGSCNGIPDSVLSVSWRVDASEPRSVQLFINSFEADEVVAYVGAELEIVCEAVSALRKVSYDTVCTFDLPNSPHGTEVLEVLRIRSGQIEESLPMDITW